MSTARNAKKMQAAEAIGGGRETEKKKEGDERAARSAASPALANASKVAQIEAASRAST